MLVEDIDVYDFEALEWALAHRFNPLEDMVVIRGLPGVIIDPTIAPEQRDIVKFGGGISHKMIIDATKTRRFGRRKEWGNDFYPPVVVVSGEEKELVEKRWREYGLEISSKF